MEWVDSDSSDSSDDDDDDSDDDDEMDTDWRNQIQVWKKNFYFLSDFNKSYGLDISCFLRGMVFM